MVRLMTATSGCAAALYLLTLSVAVPVLAGPLEDAVAADDKGDYATALPCFAGLPIKAMLRRNIDWGACTMEAGVLLTAMPTR